MLLQKLFDEKGHPSPSRRSQSRYHPRKLPWWPLAAETPWVSRLGALCRLWLAPQKPARSLRGYKTLIQLGCCLLPLPQPRAQRVCSSSKLKCLELEPIRDTFSTRMYQHSVTVTFILTGRRQQWWARELGGGMDTVAGGVMSPAAQQELNSSSRTWCHLMSLHPLLHSHNAQVSHANLIFR